MCEDVDATASLLVKPRNGRRIFNAAPQSLFDPSGHGGRRTSLDSPAKYSDGDNCTSAIRRLPGFRDSAIFSSDSEDFHPGSGDATLHSGSADMAQDVTASAGVESSTCFTTFNAIENPLFSNPLIGDSSSSILDLDDASLATIFSMILDPEYPNAVWAGTFPPGRANKLLASCTSATPGSTLAPLRYFPIDGRPNYATRNLLNATLVCHRFRRIVRKRVIKYIAAFGPDPERATADESYAGDGESAAGLLEGTNSWSTCSSGVGGGPLSVASGGSQNSRGSFLQTIAWSPVLCDRHGEEEEGEGVAAVEWRRWPVRCRARVLVATLRRDGVVPFDLRTADRHSVRHVCLLPSPECAPPATITAYDARALSCCTLLKTLTLPAPPPPTIGWNILGNFPLLSHLDYSAAAATSASVPSAAGDGANITVRRSEGPLHGTGPFPPLPLSSLTSLVSLTAPWPSLSSITETSGEAITALRLHGGGAAQLSSIAHLSRMKLLESLDISSPLRWSVDAPGCLPPAVAVDTVQIPANALAALEGLHLLRCLSLSGSSRVDGTSLEAVATLTALTALDLSVCRRVDDSAISLLTTLSHLEDLDLAWCTGVGSTGAQHIARMRTLRSLNMSGCWGLDDIGALKLANLRSLSRLQLRGCPRLGYPSLQVFGDYLAPVLLHLELSSDTDAGRGLFSVLTPRAGNGGRVAALTHLTLRGFKALPDTAFAPLQHLRGIRELVIDCCPQAGNSLTAAIAPLGTLTRLVLRFCPGVNDVCLKHLSGLSALQVLSLQGSKCLYGGGLRHVGDLKNLWHVDLQQCLCLDACGLGFLSPLRRLSILNVAKCDRIEAGDFAHLTGLQRLEHLMVLGLEPSAAEIVRGIGFTVADATT